MLPFALGRAMSVSFASLLFSLIWGLLQCEWTRPSYPDFYPYPDHLVIHAACLDHLVYDVCMFYTIILVMRGVLLHQS